MWQFCLTCQHLRSPPAFGPTFLPSVRATFLPSTQLFLLSAQLFCCPCNFFAVRILVWRFCLTCQHLRSPPAFGPTFLPSAQLFCRPRNFFCRPRNFFAVRATFLLSIYWCDNLFDLPTFEVPASVWSHFFAVRATFFAVRATFLLSVQLFCCPYIGVTICLTCQHLRSPPAFGPTFLPSARLFCRPRDFFAVRATFLLSILWCDNSVWLAKCPRTMYCVKMPFSSSCSRMADNSLFCRPKSTFLPSESCFL